MYIVSLKQTITLFIIYILASINISKSRYSVFSVSFTIQNSPETAIRDLFLVAIVRDKDNFL